ncbi:hypothetical protein TNCV_3798091 [Trichonephila clavipes]|nr:hypothetical protein TNCV_3798091 [Trichonephila clavipes]
MGPPLGNTVPHLTKCESWTTTGGLDLAATRLPSVSQTCWIELRSGKEAGHSTLYCFSFKNILHKINSIRSGRSSKRPLSTPAPSPELRGGEGVGEGKCKIGRQGPRSEWELSNLEKREKGPWYTQHKERAD